MKQIGERYRSPFVVLFRQMFKLIERRETELLIQVGGTQQVLCVSAVFPAGIWLCAG